MKKAIIILVTLAVLLLACLNICKFYKHWAGEKIPFQTVDSYFIKNDVPLEDGPNYFIIENQEEFDTLFSFAAAMSNKPAKFDFNSELVVAIVHSDVDPRVSMTIDKAYVLKNNLYIDYTCAEDSKMKIAVANQNKAFENFKGNTAAPDSFHINLVRIISLEKPADLLDLYITHNDKIKQKIALGRRLLGSPESYKKFIEKDMGTYKGVLPCADCPGIETSLTLSPDNTYVLETIYQEKGDTPLKDEGQWDISEDLAIIELFASQTYYLIVDENTLERLTPEAKRIDTDLDMTLKKITN